MKWISVKDQMPNLDEKVLVWYDNEIFIGHLMDEGGKPLYDDKLIKLLKLTSHITWTIPYVKRFCGLDVIELWYPLPQSPKDNK